MDSSFIYSSFSANTRASVTCFLGTTLTGIITTLWCRLDICSLYSSLFLWTSILFSSLLVFRIHLEKPLIHIPKSLLQNSSCETDTEIEGPGSSSKYYRWPKNVEDLGLLDLSTMDPLAFPRSLSTVVNNDVSKFCIINTPEGVI